VLKMGISLISFGDSAGSGPISVNGRCRGPGVVAGCQVAAAVALVTELLVRTRGSVHPRAEDGSRKVGQSHSA